MEVLLWMCVCVADPNHVYPHVSMSLKALEGNKEKKKDKR